MPEPVTFQRLYRSEAGLEHPATPQAIANVVKSMRESLDGENPFRVRFRMDDGSAVNVAPKGWRS